MLKSTFLVLLASLAFSTSASAITIVESYSQIDDTWTVSVTPELGEVVDPDTAAVTSGQYLLGFAIGNDFATTAWTDLQGWNADIVSQSQWDAEIAGYSAMLVEILADDAINLSVDSNVAWVGADYEQALFYSYDPVGGGSPLFGSTTYGDFFFSSQMAESPYVALVADCTWNAGVAGQDGDCTVNAQMGETTHDVPEPASMALMAAGLAGLGFSARRRRQK